MLTLQSPEALIEQMKRKNIKFDLVTEEDAKFFLENSTYYKKISSYKNNFHYAIKDGTKNYFDLDFAYLKELSTIDMHLRKIILHICLNIEHSIKIRIINGCQKQNYNGFDIVEEFINIYPSVKENILKNATTSYCSELIANHKNKLPIWVLIEVISFGDLCKLFKFLTDRDIFGDHTKYVQRDNVSILYAVHNLRNAVAHSHCILRDLRYQNNVSSLHSLSVFVSNVPEITETQRKNALTTKVYSDFTCLLYAINTFIDSVGMRKGAIDELHQIFTERMLRNKTYFVHCNPVKNAYKFFKKILDFYFF